MEGAPIPDIVVSKGSVSNDITGEEGSGSGLGDVGDEVFADVDIAYKGATVIKQFRLGKEQFGGDGVRIDLFQYISGFTTLSWSYQKGWANFLIDN
jgi:hypothetical protein